MFGWTVASKQRVNLSILMHNSNALPVTDKDAPVNTHSQALGEGQLCLGSWSTITTP